MAEEITPIEERWARGWIKGIASVLALGPPGESPEEYKREIETIERVALEPGAKAYELAKRWRKRLIEILTA